MNELADYDKYDYDYKSYWTKRKYEHQAELIVLEKFLKDVKGKRFVDIGGSYGRLLNTYIDKFDEVVIVDYSLKTLQRKYEELQSKGNNIHLIAANGYQLPFKEGSFDGGMMVRVMHHITDQKRLFNSLYRVLDSKSVFILEVPNKIHLKNRLKARTGGISEMLDMEPYQQQSQGNNEGSQQGEYVPFLNYHPEYIIDLLDEAKFHIEDRQGCSYFRSTPISRHLPLAISSVLEKIFQRIFKPSYFAPSIFLRILQKPYKNLTRPLIENYKILSDALCCPRCYSDIGITEGISETKCSACNSIYYKRKGVWDFRVD